MVRLRAAARQREGPQRRHYGSEIKQLIDHQHFKLLRGTGHIAFDLNIPQRVVQRTVKMWKEIGDVIREPLRVGRARILSDAHIRVSSITSHFDLLLIEIPSISLLLQSSPPPVPSSSLRPFPPSVTGLPDTSEMRTVERKTVGDSEA